MLDKTETRVLIKFTISEFITSNFKYSKKTVKTLWFSTDEAVHEGGIFGLLVLGILKS